MTGDPEDVRGTRGDLNKAWVSVHHVSSSLFVTNVLHKGNQVWGSQLLSLFYRKSKTPLKSTTYSEATRKVSLVLRNGRRGAGTVGPRGDWVALAEGRRPGALCARAEHRGGAGVRSLFQEPVKPAPGPSEGGGLYDAS